VQDGSSDFMRVAVNSTFGFGGLLDIASEAGLQKHKEDFGQTLGTWGMGSGPYVVLPLFGPSTLRDTAALPVDIYGDVWAYTTPVDVRNTGIVVRAVDQRAAALDATNLLEDAALDRYSFVRSAYLQRRASLIRDGAIEDEAPKPKAAQPVEPQSDAGALLPVDAPVAAGAGVEPAAATVVETAAHDTANPPLAATADEPAL
jgi:phospholipid-binding lipoprotein MlaA